MITTRELKAIRDAIGETLPDSCYILTPVTSSDGQGGMETTWGTSTVATPCRLDCVSGKEVLTAGVIQPFTRWILTLPYDTTILNTYRILHNGHLYSVVGRTDHDSSWFASMRVIVESL